jgi:lysophospholipase L1-like esterase
MKRKTLCCMGDSITGGYFCASPASRYSSVLLSELRTKSGQGRWDLLSGEMSANYPYLGLCWRTWRDQYREMMPDVVVFQAGENDYSSTVSSITGPLGGHSTSMTVAGGSLVSGRAYILSNGTDEEVVIPQDASGTTGRRLIRAAMGTAIHDWPAHSVIRTWNNSAASTMGAWTDTYEYIMRYLLNTTQPSTVILIGGLWFQDQSGAGGRSNEAVRGLVDTLQGEGNARIEFCPFVTADGVSLTAAGTSILSKSIFTGPTALLQADIGATNPVTIEVSTPTDIQVGDYLVLTRDAGNATPTYANSEIVCVTAVDYNNSEVTVSRAQLGSATPAPVAPGLPGAGTVFFGPTVFNGTTYYCRVCKLATACIAPRAPWATLGSNASWANLHCQYDTHTNDRGQREVGYAFYRGYERVMARI